MSNFREMAPERLLKNFKLLKYEHVIYHFKARGLEISNIITLAKYSNFAILWTL